MDQVVINRYLSDQLSDAERAEFEDRMLASPAVIEELEAAARLKAGLVRLRESGQLERIVFSPARWPQPHVLALAASLAAIAIGIAVWRSDDAGLSTPMLAASVVALTDESGRQLDIVGRHAVLRTRAEGYDAVIERPHAAGALEIRVLPDMSAAPAGEEGRYRVDLARLGEDVATPVATVAGLRPQADGFVTLFASSSELPPGRYRLSITRESEAGSPADTDSFSIRVR
ncbi:MAG TPA: hypothetical protein VJ011_04770 [Steroidobacteraceae bacterium]|nr:hypothetical protein [Steroidobacteraceae bacterium]